MVELAQVREGLLLQLTAEILMYLKFLLVSLPVMVKLEPSGGHNNREKLYLSYI